MEEIDIIICLRKITRTKRISKNRYHSMSKEKKQELKEHKTKTKKQKQKTKKPQKTMRLKTLKKKKDFFVDLIIYAMFFSSYTAKFLIVASSKQTDRDKSLIMHD